VAVGTQFFLKLRFILVLATLLIGTCGSKW